MTPSAADVAAFLARVTAKDWEQVVAEYAQGWIA